MSRLQKYRSDMTKPIKVDVVSKPSLPSEPQPIGPLASRRDPTAVNQNLGPCAAPVNQNQVPGVAEPFSPQASTQEYEGLFEKLPVSYQQSAQLLYHHLHELDGFENERGFNSIKIHDKLYNATDLLTDLILNRKSRYAIKSLSTTINKPSTDFVTKEMAKNLKQVYENIGKFGALSSPRRLALAANTSQQEALKFLEKQESYTLHRRVVRPKHFRKTIALYPFEIAQADLMSLDGSYAKHNAPYKFLLVIIDVFSRKLFVKPLKSKHGSEFAKQLEQVFSEQTFKKIHVDKGKEFLNPSVKKTLEKYQIELHHIHSHLKATIVERSIRTLRSHLSAFCTHFNTFSFVPRLDLIVSQYNDSPHCSLGNLAPNQVSSQNTPYISDFMYDPR
ncbi:hypothetical protein QYM36_004231 [Artemia franciscana]|uniref:Integrase catalytic domain-containing protein n=1 Tax=Artemia franciscana TaxID=6661 RepID=A0AA88LCE1_ARTSF|nr:hypothetical protein QYM36_004231 [Artemia franciscana]